MIQGRKSPRKVPAIPEFQKSSELLVNGGRLSGAPLSNSSLLKPNPRPSSRTLHRGLQQYPTRPFTAHPTTHSQTERISPSFQTGTSPYKPFRSATQLRTSEKKPIKSQPLPNLQMAPLTVPLLPQAGARNPSMSKRSHSPMRSRPRSPRISGSPYSHRKNLLGPDSIQLLRPNNTLVELQKIDLDRRGFTSWPSPSWSEPPRLLSLQHNLLTRLDPPLQLPSIVLLDLYHNHLKSLVGLHALPNLRILLLAKNRLSRLDGLESATKLEVLDLHGNQLHHLTNLSHLKELRLLNLAGNMLRHVSGLRGLDSLSELNLKRNQIRTVAELHTLPRLEKVFLSYNEIYRYDDISVLTKCTKLKELSLEENPISKQPLYNPTAVVKFFRLKKLDDQELTVEIRRNSERILQKSKDKERAKAAQITDEERRKSAINSAKKHWSTIKVAQFMIIRKNQLKSTESSGEIQTTNEKTEPSSVSEKTDSEDKFQPHSKISEEEPPITNSVDAKLDAREVPIIQETIDETSESGSHNSESSILSSSKEESPKTNCLRVPPEKNSPRREFSRSKSSLDIIVSSQKSEVITPTKRNLRPKSGVDTRNRQSPGLGNKQLLVGSPSPSLRFSGTNEKFKNGVKMVIRRHSESKLFGLRNNQSALKNNNEAFEKGTDCRFSSSNLVNKVLLKSESSNSLRSLPDRVLTAAVTKIQSNLHRLHSSADVRHSLDRIMTSKNHPNSNLDKQDCPSSESSEGESESDSDSTTVSNANVESETKRSSSFAQLKIPLTRPRYHSRSEASSPTRDKNPLGILREQGPNYLAELDGKVLRMYGSGALKCTDLQWEKGATVTASAVHFQYIDFDEIVNVFPKLRVRFPHLENFVFVETNLTKCCQLNALAELHQVNSIFIKRDGNTLIIDPNWRLYAIFRLSHWGLTTINGTEITEAERQEASYLYSPLGQLAFTCLPRHQLNALISTKPQNTSNNTMAINNNNNELEGKEECDDEDGGTTWEGPRLNSPHLQELIGKEALQYRHPSKLTKEEISGLLEAGASTQNLLTWALESVKRLQKLEEVWPSVLHDLTRDSVTDIIKPNYGKICLDSLKRELGWKK